VNKHAKNTQEKDSCARAPTHSSSHTPSLTDVHTMASDLSACQHTKRPLCPLITLVQPPLQEAVSLTSLAHGRNSELGPESRTMPSLLEEERSHREL